MTLTTLGDILSHLKISPVLIDVGASGAPPTIWQNEIAKHSIYVGFDPDLREIAEIADGVFHKAIMINKAVTADETADTVMFYLTRSPFCSSTLPPNREALDHYLYADYFDVQNQVSASATTLNAVIQQLGLSGVDWIKLDSQGTDLRIFNSLSQEIRSQVVALDVEPGLIDFYQGEDIFVDVHRELIRCGFWLSDLAVRGTARMRPATLSQIVRTHPRVTRPQIERAARPAPGWVEVRYLRTTDWLIQEKLDRRAYALLWAFSLLDRQFGFALDVAAAYEQTFGQSDLSQAMREVAISRLGAAQPKGVMVAGKRLLKLLLPSRARRWLKSKLS